MRIILIFFLTLTVMTSCGRYQGVPENYHSLLDTAMVRAGENRSEIEKALRKTPGGMKEGMAYIISYMPERDLRELKSDLLLENIIYGYKSRERFPWCRELPDSVFFNEVLPYANITEKREQWRKNFYERFFPYVDSCTNIVDAIFAINKNIINEVGVEYNTMRRRADQGPFESMEQGMASCTGLSILLTDAFRAVGIPSRLAGTPMWTNMKGNHTWSEVLVDGEWMFTEYYPDTLNRSWFVADAGKADPENPIHWIYAVSYKPTGLLYPTFPSPDNGQPEKPYVNGINVTQRYIDLYLETIEKNRLAPDQLIVDVVVYLNDSAQRTSKDRMSCLVTIFEEDEKIDYGYSPLPTDDMNRFLKFTLKKNKTYNIVLTDIKKPGYEKRSAIKTGTGDNQQITLFFE